MKKSVKKSSPFQKAGKKVRKCRICGCSDFDACPGGCYWAEKDLCSACEREWREKR